MYYPFIREGAVPKADRHLDLTLAVVWVLNMRSEHSYSVSFTQVTG